jgi:hypothetical protein
MISWSDCGCRSLPSAKKDSGRSPLPISSGNVAPPESQYQDVLARGSGKTAGGLSGFSSPALFVPFRLHRGRQQLRPEASARRAPALAAQKQRLLSGQLLGKAWKGLRQARPSQE